MLPSGGRAADDTTRGVVAEGAAQGELEADDSTIGRSDRCRGDNRCRDDYDDYVNRGAGKDDAPLDDRRRKRIRRMGNDVKDNTFFFAKSFLIGRYSL